MSSVSLAREEDRASIKSVVDQIRTQHEQLKVSIKTIKEQCRTWKGVDGIWWDSSQ
jgi:hypothetical protein